MQVILKWIAHLILLPLIKEAIAYLVYRVKTNRENKQLEIDNKRKVNEFKDASPDTAHVIFSKLP